jgi:hypothetical protein
MSAVNSIAVRGLPHHRFRQKYYLRNRPPLALAERIIPKLEDPDFMLRAPLLRHPLQKRTVVQWDMGALLGRRRWRR